MTRTNLSDAGQVFDVQRPLSRSTARRDRLSSAQGGVGEGVGEEITFCTLDHNAVSRADVDGVLRLRNVCAFQEKSTVAGYKQLGART